MRITYIIALIVSLLSPEIQVFSQDIDPEIFKNLKLLIKNIKRFPLRITVTMLKHLVTDGSILIGLVITLK